MPRARPRRLGIDAFATRPRFHGVAPPIIGATVHLNRIHIVGNHDEGRLLVFDERGEVVDAVLDKQGLGGFRGLAAGRDGLGSRRQARLFFLLGLGAVLVQELEQVGRGVLVEHAGELVDGRRDLEPLLEDGLLALQADVLGPLDVAREVAGRLDVLADAKVAGGLFEEGVLCASEAERANRQGNRSNRIEYYRVSR